MSQKFYVSHNGEQVGPYSFDEIVVKVNQGELTIMDYLYDEKSEDWVGFVEHAELLQHIKESKPKAPPKKQEEALEDTSAQNVAFMQAEQKARELTSSNENQKNIMAEWYILKGENKFGPFAFTDVIKMLQQKLIFEFDYVWKKGMKAWVRIADMTAFQYENIKKLQETLMPEIQEIFFRRRHRRVKYGATILVHDNNSVWKGQGVEISQGGAGIFMENAMIVPGQKLYLHFKPGDGVPPFNAVCEVVSKKYDENVKEKSSSVLYGVKFTNISEDTQGVLKEYAEYGEDAA